MQTARNYVNDATGHMPIVASAAAKPLPSSMQEITRYVEQLLTPEQEAVCDMATD